METTEKKKRIELLLKEHNIDPARFEKAQSLVEACIQNNQELGLSPQGDVSVAHIATSAPDCALLLALWEVGAPLEEVNNDQATPLHVLALRMVTEVEEGRKCAKIARSLGLSFTTPVTLGVSPAVTVVDQDWPTWSQQWNGWKEMNARKPVTERLSTIELFLAYWRHRKIVKQTRNFLYSLG